MRGSTHYLIVGAGVIGLSIAEGLARRGARVTVLERATIAGGASGGNLGQISLMDRFEDWHLELALESMERYRVLGRAGEFGFRQHGGTILLMQPDQVERAEAVRAMHAPRGLSMELLGAQEARRLEPHLRKQGLLGAAFCPREGSLDPLALCHLLADRAVRAGVELRLGEELTHLETEGGCIRTARTDAADLAVDCLVDATGGWSASLAGMLGETTPIRHHKGTAFVTPPLPRLLQTTLVGGGFLMGPATDAPADAVHIGTALCQQANGSIILGQATEQSEVDDRSCSREGLARTAANLLRYFPVLSGVDVIRSWAVSTSYSADGLPVFGFSPNWENLFTAAGFKGAFTTAPAVADRAVGMLMDGDTFVEEILPGRTGQDREEAS